MSGLTNQIGSRTRLIGQTIDVIKGAVSAANNTYTTIYTLGGTEDGAWLVFGTCATEGAQKMELIMSASGGGSHVGSAIYSNAMFVQMSGDSIQLKHQAGGTVSMEWSIIKLTHSL